MKQKKKSNKHHSAINRKSGDYIQTSGENIWIILFEPHAGIFTLSDEYAHTNTTQWDFDDIVWIPRQDQLWDMVDFGGIKWWTDVNNYKHFADKMAHSDIFKFKTWEQMLLAFVMKEKFQKKWLPEEQKWGGDE